MKKILITLLCIIFGPFVAWEGLSTIVTALRAKSWPTAQGIVESAQLTSKPARRGRMTYRPVIRYAYEIDGARHLADRVDYGDRGTSSIDTAMGVIARYPEGRMVTVHYNRKDPDVAVLEAGTTIGNWLTLGVGLALCGFGVVSARSLWQNLNSNQFAPSSGF